MEHHRVADSTDLKDETITTLWDPTTPHSVGPIRPMRPFTLRIGRGAKGHQRGQQQDVQGGQESPAVFGWKSWPGAQGNYSPFQKVLLVASKGLPTTELLTQNQINYACLCLF